MKIMVDSGAFSAFNQGTTVDIQEYIRFIKENLGWIEAYINLDVINDGEASYENFLTMIAAGLKPIPVYHAESDIKYLKLYLKSTDYIAIGAISNLSSAKRVRNLDYLWMHHLTDSRGYPLAKFHGLGLTTAEIIYRYPWFSIDSSTWMMTSRRGIIVIPKIRSGRPKYDEAPIRIEISSKSPHLREECGHLETLSKYEREQVEEYIASKGFTVGKSEWIEGEEVVVEEGLCNNYKMRDRFNLLYFEELQRTLPEWPWPFALKRRTISLFQ